MKISKIFKVHENSFIDKSDLAEITHNAHMLVSQPDNSRRE